MAREPVIELKAMVRHPDGAAYGCMHYQWVCSPDGWSWKSSLADWGHWYTIRRVRLVRVWRVRRRSRIGRGGETIGVRFRLVGAMKLAYNDHMERDERERTAPPPG
jgi:hypothetical protein